MPKKTYTAAQKLAFVLRMKKRFAKKKKKAGPKKKKTSVVKSVVKKELAKRVETYMNASRLTNQQPLVPASGNFGNTVFFFGNLGGDVPVGGQTFIPMNTIAATQLVTSGGVTTSNNQAFTGREIFGKRFNTKVTLTLPSVRTQPTGGADWQQLPVNYEYRALIFKVKNRPGAGPSQSGQQQAPMVNLLQNEIGAKFGPLSPNSLCVPEAGTGAGVWLNNDLLRQRLNRTNWHFFKEQKGRLSVGSTMSATSNSASVTSGASRYPSEAVINLSIPINKKIQLDVDTVPDPDSTKTALDYNNSIYLAIFLNPMGELQNYEATWNNAITPYIHISNTFTWSDP